MVISKNLDQECQFKKWTKNGFFKMDQKGLFQNGPKMAIFKKFGPIRLILKIWTKNAFQNDYFRWVYFYQLQNFCEWVSTDIEVTFGNDLKSSLFCHDKNQISICGWIILLACTFINYIIRSWWLSYDLFWR